MLFRSPAAPLSDEGRRFVALLQRYPTISGAELVALRAMSANLSMADIERIWRSDGLAAQMTRFYDENSGQLEAPPLAWMVAIVMAALVIGVLLSVAGVAG